LFASGFSSDWFEKRMAKHKKQAKSPNLSLNPESVSLEIND